jgi:hypothetical protein
MTRIFAVRTIRPYVVCAFSVPLKQPKLYRLILLLLGTLACGVPAAVTPSPRATLAPTVSPAVQPLAGTPVAVPATALAAPPVAALEPVEVRSPTALPGFPLELEAVANPELLASLSGAQRAMLAREGFVVAPATATHFDDIYREAQAMGQPLFITSDFLLHTFWLVTDGVVAQVEEDHLLPDLRALSQAMVTLSLSQLQAAQSSPWGEPVEEAAWRNLAFFSVAVRLLEPDFAVPPAVAGVVAEELLLIEQAQTLFISPLTGQPQDYRQFRSQDRYAEREEMGRYFRALTWYGLNPFRLGDTHPDRARLAARQALLVTGGLEDETMVARWLRLWRLARFFYGTAGPQVEFAWTIPQVAALARAVYGDLPGVLDLADTGQLDTFLVTVYARQAEASEEGAETATEPAPFRFLPERRLPDRFFIDQLIFNRVGLYEPASGNEGESGRVVDEAALPFTAVSTAIGPVRAFARGLDMAALFGSQRALALLSEAGDTHYVGYQAQFARLQQLVPPHQVAGWTDSLAGGWLYSLQPLLQEHPPARHPYLNSPAWADRQLNSWFAAWLELRRRPAWSGEAGREALPVASVPSSSSVEPEPLLYARLAALAAQLQQELADNGIAGEENAVLAQLEELLRWLAEISETERRGEPLAATDEALVQQLSLRLPALVATARAPGPAVAMLTTLQHDPHSDQVLQAGLGEVWRLFIVTGPPEQPIIAVGGVYSTYEFKRAAGARLAEDDWRQLDPRPPWPDWTVQYVAP